MTDDIRLAQAEASSRSGIEDHLHALCKSVPGRYAALMRRVPYMEGNLYVPVATSIEGLLSRYSYSLFINSLNVGPARIQEISDQAIEEGRLRDHSLLFAAAFLEADPRKNSSADNRWLVQHVIPLADDADMVLLTYLFSSIRPDEVACTPSCDAVEILKLTCKDYVRELAVGTSGLFKQVASSEDMLNVLIGELTDRKHLPPYYPVTYVSVYETEETEELSANPLGISTWIRQVVFPSESEELPRHIREMANFEEPDVQGRIVDLSDRSIGARSLEAAITKATVDIVYEVASLRSSRFWIRFNVLRSAVANAKSRPQLSRKPVQSYLEGFRACLRSLEDLMGQCYAHSELKGACVLATVWITDRSERDIRGWFITASSGGGKMRLDVDRNDAMLTRLRSAAPKLHCRYVPVSNDVDTAILERLLTEAEDHLISLEPKKLLARTLHDAYKSLCGEFGRNSHSLAEKSRELVNSPDKRVAFFGNTHKYVSKILEIIAPSYRRSAWTWTKPSAPFLPGVPLNLVESRLLSVARCLARAKLPLLFLWSMVDLDVRKHDPFDGDSESHPIQDETVRDLPVVADADVAKLYVDNTEYVLGNKQDAGDPPEWARRMSVIFDSLRQLKGDDKRWEFGFSAFKSIESLASPTYVASINLSSQYVGSVPEKVVDSETDEKVPMAHLRATNAYKLVEGVVYKTSLRINKEVQDRNQSRASQLLDDILSTESAKCVIGYCFHNSAPTVNLVFKLRRID